MATGSITATGGTSDAVVHGDFNLSIWGTFVATIQPERSFDGGTTWLPMTALGSPITFNVPVTEVLSEPELAVHWRLNCTSYTSGTANWRISQ